jgi:hypothetical protein
MSTGFKLLGPGKQFRLIQTASKAGQVNIHEDACISLPAIAKVSARDVDDFPQKNPQALPK